MPLFISEQDISWDQTIDYVRIIVNVPVRIDENISILTSSKYLKINSPPNIWECFLYSTIDTENSLTRLVENTVIFELIKNEKKIWTSLFHPDSSDKKYCKVQRQLAAEEIKNLIHSDENQKAEIRSEKQRAAIRNQIESQNRERKRIANEKKLENERVTKEIEAMKKEKLNKCKSVGPRDKVADLPKAIPPPRKSGHITVTFTPRVFPSASRESQEPQEQEWLKKQAASTKTVEFDSADLSPAEKDPDWLKKKADSMCRRGDYRSAVNAYTLAIQICPNMYSLYAGRCECHLHLNNLHKCIEDSSKALEMLVPAVKLNEADRIKCHKIRGDAFQRLELYVEGLMDYEAALKIDPQNEILISSSEKLRALIERSD